MRAADLIPSANERLRTSLHVLPVFVAVLYLVRIVLGPAESGFKLGPILFAILIVLGYLGLAVLPWQWTGDDADQASFLRGLLQAVVWNVVWLTILVQGGQFFLREAGLSGLVSNPWIIPNPWIARVAQSNYFILLNFPVSLVVGFLLAERDAALRQRRRSDERAAALESSERQAQAMALQAQMNPHVLYNVLGGIAELVHQAPDLAETALLDLSDLLRKLTRYGRLASIRLGQERELVAQYLAIEGMRLGRRLKVEWDWPLGLDDVEVPPLVLQPLVENAVRHGVARSKVPGTIRISARRAGAPGPLVLRVANEGPPWDPEAAGDGVGVGNLRQRLLFREGASLTLTHEGGITVAEVNLGKETGHDR